MDLSKKILTILAIFCVIASAGVACAADGDSYLGTNYADDSYGYSGSQYQDGYGTDDGIYDDDYGVDDDQYEYDGGYAGSQYQDDGGWAGSQYNETLENSNTTNSTPMAAGEPAQNATNTTNSTPMAAGEPVQNTTNATSPHTMLSTGNPILALFAVCAVLGGYTVFRRK